MGANQSAAQQPSQNPTQSFPRFNPAQSQPLQPEPPLQGQSATPQSAFFDSLLERSRQRPNEEDANDGLGRVPSLQLGLPDIARRVRELGGVGATRQPGRAQDSRA